MQLIIYIIHCIYLKIKQNKIKYKNGRRPLNIEPRGLDTGETCRPVLNNDGGGSLDVGNRMLEGPKGLEAGGPGARDTRGGTGLAPVTKN